MGSIDHLFVYSQFSIQIWKSICEDLDIFQTWGSLSFEKDSISGLLFVQNIALPMVISWGIWNVRNSHNFEDWKLISVEICVKIISLCKYYQSAKSNPPKIRQVTHITLSQEEMGFF